VIFSTWFMPSTSTRRLPLAAAFNARASSTPTWMSLVPCTMSTGMVSDFTTSAGL